MRIIVAIALVASLLAGCGPSVGPEWIDKAWKDADTPGQMGGG